MQAINIENIIKNEGIIIIENYINNDICKNIIINMEKNKGNFEYCNTNSHIFGSGNDLRCKTYEKYDKYADGFLNDNNIHNLFEKILERKINVKRCQAGIVKFNKDNITSSGGGWHIDNKKIQLKAILYLNDVNTKNGPFIYIKNTQGGLDLENTIGDISKTRFDDTIIKTSEKIKKENIMEVTGKAGTLILVRTDNIHKGKIIEEGVRYSLTNYYY